MFKLHLSLKYKFMIALTTLAIVSVSVLLVLSVQIFKNDKIAYVFDSSLSVSKSKSQVVRAEISTLAAEIQSIVSGFESENKTINESGQRFFERQKSLQYFYIFDLKNNLELARLSQKTEPGNSDPLQAEPGALQKLLQQASLQRFAIVPSASSDAHLWLALKVDALMGAQDLIAIGYFEVNNLSQTFNEASAIVSFLVSPEGELIVKSNGETTFPQDWSLPSILSDLQARGRAGDAAVELMSPSGRSFLISVASVGVGDLKVLSMIEKSAALKAVQVLLRRAMLLFFTILSSVVLLSIFTSRALTSALGELARATEKIAHGDFGIRLEAKSRDEIGVLSLSFNKMAQEVARLIQATIEKGRMESELKTARTVQDNLFPAEGFKNETLELEGLYRPASECGGDWWYCFQHPTGIYVLIADATGHGAPAALMTAAAKATINLMSREKELNLRKLTDAFNHCLFHTANGNLLMTGFVLHIKSSGEVEYVNASHEPAILVTGADFDFLMEPNGPRFGQSPLTVYESGRFHFKPGQLILLYTDGISGQKNKDQKELGDRKLLRFLKNEKIFEMDLKELNAKTFALVDDYRQSVPQDDDLTIVSIRFKT